MGDVRDVLGISTESLAAAKEEAQVLKQEQLEIRKEQKKQVSKEVYRLLDNRSLNNLPSVLPVKSSSQNLTKQRIRQLSAKKAVKWTFSPFENQARIDGLKLSHWKLEEHQPKAYSFVKYNKRAPASTLSKATCNQLQESSPVDDPIHNWTFEEASFLFHMAGKYEYRWFVIADRWIGDEMAHFYKESGYSATSSKPQSSFDLKSIYFRLATIKMESQEEKMETETLYDKLADKRSCSDKTNKMYQHILEKFSNGDKLGREKQRREYLTDYYAREPMDPSVEQDKISELNSLDKQIEDLRKQIKKKENEDLAVGADFLKKNKTFIQLYMNNLNKSNDSILALQADMFKLRKISGAFLRSTRVFMFPTRVSVGKRIVEKILRVLDEAKVLRRPKFVSTERTVEKYDKLRQDVLKLLLLQKHLKKLQQSPAQP